MAMYTSALARQSYKIFGTGVFQRQLKVGPVAAKWLTTTSCVKGDVLKSDEGFWDKNKRLNRPMSPHLGIYKWQVTMIGSITHRATGLALSGIMSGFAVGMLMLPGSFPHYLVLLESMHWGGACIFLLKYALSWPFMFHFANGLRHLAWDMGKGFENKEVTTSGIAVAGVATVLAIIVSAM